jgi:hypothetical protein
MVEIEAAIPSGELETDDAGRDKGHTKQADRSRRLAKGDDADNDCSGYSDAAPDRISRGKRDRSERDGHAPEAQRRCGERSDAGPKTRESIGLLKAECP